MPNIGEVAPDFTLPNQDGEMITLSDLRGKKIIIFAFPKANTSGCTVQACGFRDHFPQIQTANAIVFGLSADTQEELRSWKDQENLPYDLLSDVDHEVLNSWGVWQEMTFKERTFEGIVRSYWVIDEDGKIIAAQVRVTPEDSIEQAVAAVGG